METEDFEEKSFYSINAGWAIASVVVKKGRITISAEKLLGESGYQSNGYMYRAHINLNKDWSEHLPETAREWETKQRKSNLWETLMDEDFNYSHTPWDNRPNLKRIVEYLNNQGEEYIGSKIAETYKPVI